jgi:hypothetical protein
MSDKIFQAKVSNNEGDKPVMMTTTNSVTTQQDNTMGYCVKCKSKHEIVNPQKVAMKNGKPALKGTCKVCNTAMFKIIKKEAAQQ